MRIVGLRKIWPFFFACRNSDRSATIRLSRCLSVTASRAAMMSSRVTSRRWS
ncbi:hypothetical protein EES42_41990 [Streptomyces sp. ADI95-17]|nr:hypothetical protein EES42_41990 [Streptomyces sp. ADI95-17]